MRIRPSIRFALLFVALFAFQIILTYQSGAFRSEFGGHPDEAGHYITGLMVRDYIAKGLPQHPITFAEEFYIHYPKVALGHWPPFFYIVQAAWTLVFSEGRVSMMLLMSVLSALLAALVFLSVEKDFGTIMGGILGLLTLSLPIIQKHTGMVMAEIPISLLSFCAILFLIMFFETSKTRYVIAFSSFASLAILTKGNGLSLALVPPIYVLLSRDFRVIRRAGFWVMPLIVAVLCVPFYVSTIDMVINGWAYRTPGMKFTANAFPFYINATVNILGIGLCVFFCIGFFDKIIRPFFSGHMEKGWAVYAAFILSVFIFQIIIPAGFEARHLIPAIPPTILFIAAGIVFVSRKLPLASVTVTNRNIMVALFVGMFFIVETFTVPLKVWGGFANVTGQILSRRSFDGAVILASSDSVGEGMLISEVAMCESRPNRVVLRASKVLSQSRWDGGNYTMLFDSAKDIIQYIEDVPIRLVILDNSRTTPEHVKHHELLKKTIEQYPEKWEFLGSYALIRDATANPGAVNVYELISQQGRKAKRISVRMDNMLGYEIIKHFND